MLQKVIMRFLQAGPVSQFLRTAALPGGVMLDHTGVQEPCTHKNRRHKESGWVLGKWGSVLFPH